MAEWHRRLTADGYTLLPSIFSPDEVRATREACRTALEPGKVPASVLSQGGGPAYGARNLLRLWEGIVSLMRKSPLAEALVRVLGPRGGLVRGLYFDKPPGHSWALPWHRDLTIAVKEHGPLGRFKKPTRKAGVPHVEAPPDLLETMVTARIHLDPMNDHNGPLRLVACSHLCRGDGDQPPTTLRCAAGDVLLMRPLLLHASGHCAPDNQQHRRIVHLEFAPRPDLPDGYEWHDFLPIRDVA